MLEEVAWLRGELDQLVQNVDNQISDLEPFITGRRRSEYPLGSKLLINVGQELDRLRAEISLRMTGMMP